MSNPTSEQKLARVEREALKVANDPLLAKMLEEERIESEEFDLRLLFKLLRYVVPYRGAAILAVALSVVESVLMTLPAYILGLAVDRITAAKGRESQAIDGALDGIAVAISGALPLGPEGLIFGFGALVLGAWALRWITAVITGYLVQRLGQQVVHDLRVDIYNHITGMSLNFFHNNPVGRLVNRTTFDVQSLSELFSDAFAQGMRDLLFIIVLILVMFQLDVVLAGILVGSFPILVVVAFVYRAVARPSMRTMQAVQSRMNSWLSENLSGMRENQLYRQEDRRRAEFKDLTEAHQAAVRKVVQAWGLLRPAMMITTALATAIILFVGYDKVLAGTITVGVLLTFLQYTTRVWVPIRNLTEKVNVIQTALTAGERVFDILETPSQMVDAPDANQARSVTKGQVEFKEVRFSYKPEEEVLRGISFLASPGEMIALIGDTGAGKSTIVSLVSRFYDVDTGAVCVDGVDVRKYPLRSLRSGVALVPQDVVIFAGTIRDNIALGAMSSDDEIMDAVRAVHADHIVSRFEDGLDHDLEEGGRTLSGGERQLLAFARALLLNPPILILDEATASIDTRTEQLIQDALERLTAGRTTIVIAHRLSTVKHADQILVLRHGEVIERGTHESLLVEDREYAKLYRKYVSEEQ